MHACMHAYTHKYSHTRRIQACANKAPFMLESLQQPPTSLPGDVLHFLYFSTAMNQFVTPGLSPPYTGDADARVPRGTSGFREQM